MTREEILKTADGEAVRFMRLQFTDILGVIKNVEIPRSQFEKALDGQILFDGSKVARMICDIYMPDGSPFAGCPRMTLKRQVERAGKHGYTMVAGPEAEF